MLTMKSGQASQPFCLRFFRSELLFHIRRPQDHALTVIQHQEAFRGASLVSAVRWLAAHTATPLPS